MKSFLKHILFTLCLSFIIIYIFFKNIIVLYVVIEAPPSFEKNSNTMDILREFFRMQSYIIKNIYKKITQ